MNGGTPGQAALWQEARAADGRVYYYNVQTKATQWTRPPEMMGAAERALANQPWKEYTADGGRKYWYNTETKQSSWDMPDVYKQALAAQDAQPTPVAPSSAAPQFVAGGNSYSSYPSRDGRDSRDYRDNRDRDDYERAPASRRLEYGQPPTSGIQIASIGGTDPEYSTFEEAEAAFMKLLRRVNVQPDWSWEETMKAAIKDPQYRALKDPKDRKAAFEKYAVEVRAQEKDKAKERLAKLRADFGTMLRRHPEIKHYSRWKTIRPIIEGETIFRSSNDDDERRQLFEEYIIELKKEHAEKEAASRKAAKEELVTILKNLNLEPYTRWGEAQTLIQGSEAVKKDEKFKTLTKSDILTAFEGHIKELERAYNAATQKQKATKLRKERRNRDNFMVLLQELRAQGKIRAGSQWMKLVPEIKDDPRYIAMLGQSGSTPLDLFWDIVEEEERALRGRRNDALDVLDDKRFEVTAKTTFEEFHTIMQSDRRTAAIDREALQLIFSRIHEKVTRRNEDEKHAADRHQRRAIDALRSRIKRLEPPVRAADTWETIRPRLEKLEEYTALEDDEARKTAFDKVIRRLKEKEDDLDHRERDRSRRRDDRDHRDRDYRNGASSSYRRSRYSRTPEPDAYEADRRKAQADREKNYRRSDRTLGLTPPPRDRSDRDRDRDREGRLVDRERERERDRDPRDRDRDRERDPRDTRHISHYERERRDREEERERLYRTRGDPHGSRDELDYGGDAGATAAAAKRASPAPSASMSLAGADRRRRRESDAGSVGSARKRYRRDERERDGHRERRDREERRERRHRTRTPEKEAEKVEEVVKDKEEKAIHSGSEEGEIEEED